MFKIIKNDQTLAIIATPKWIKLQDNGCFTLCSEEEAAGVVVDGEVYHLFGRPELPGKQDVSVIGVDAGNLIDTLLAENKLLKVQVDTLSQTHDFHEELIVELAEIVYA